jgi:hypothetical protein
MKLDFEMNIVSCGIEGPTNHIKKQDEFESYSVIQISDGMSS